jgi:hypothetical protein
MQNLLKKYHASFLLLVLLIVAISVSGCGGASQVTKAARVPSASQVELIQNVILQYQATHEGLLPLVAADETVSRYEKYRIDFSKLMSANLLGEIPPSAYQNGGNYYYLILNEETAPLVRVQNLVHTMGVNDVQLAADQYLSEQGKLALLEDQVVDKFFYLIDYDVLNIKAPELISDYSGQPLTLMMDRTGTVYINYEPDMYRFIQQNPELAENTAQDMRNWVVENAIFVPVRSAAYIMMAGGQLGTDPKFQP